MTSKTLSATSLCVLAALLQLHVDLAAAGSTYIRWGRSTCPSGVRALYKGYIAGAHQDHTGSASNLICAHESPQWGENNVPGWQDWSGLIYGAEFGMAAQGGYPNNKPFKSDNARGADLGSRDAVCVVCYVPKCSTSVTIHGRQDCGEGNEDFKLQYKGYLMSEYYGRKVRTEFICMDEAPEARLGSEASSGGALLFPVQAGCGSLPCPDYVGGNEVTCAVCTK